jgi:hypothetical protein
MSDEKVAIALRALRASGDERAADVVQAILGSGDAPAPAAGAVSAAPTAPATPEIPAAPLVPAPVAAVDRGPQPPPGKAPLQSLDEWEALPQDERIARLDECDALQQQGQR